ncbi:hypothetical protein FB451DRAFT_1529054 [Mycena latifolia]|nr:hypothetical protein FB451DRAFT_1529054 [Mycena latifolia]
MDVDAPAKPARRRRRRLRPPPRSTSPSAPAARPPTCPRYQQGHDASQRPFPPCQPDLTTSSRARWPTPSMHAPDTLLPPSCTSALHPRMPHAQRRPRMRGWLCACGSRSRVLRSACTTHVAPRTGRRLATICTELERADATGSDVRRERRAAAGGAASEFAQFAAPTAQRADTTGSVACERHALGRDVEPEAGLATRRGGALRERQRRGRRLVQKKPVGVPTVGADMGTRPLGRAGPAFSSLFAAHPP